jgi:hypothetical protein
VKRVAGLLILSSCLLCGSVFAQPSKTASADELPAGLGKLHWGMNARQVLGLYPDLNGKTPETDQPLSNMSLDPIAYATCRFSVDLTFEAGHLSGVALNADDPAAYRKCSGKVRAALVQQYGSESGGIAPDPHFGGSMMRGEWSGPVTNITYSDLKDDYIEIKFEPGFRQR